MHLVQALIQQYAQCPAMTLVDAGDIAQQCAASDELWQFVANYHGVGHLMVPGDEPNTAAAQATITVQLLGIAEDDISGLQQALEQVDDVVAGQMPQRDGAGSHVDTGLWAGRYRFDSLVFVADAWVHSLVEYRWVFHPGLRGVVLVIVSSLCPAGALPVTVDEQALHDRVRGLSSAQLIASEQSSEAD